MTRRDCLTVHLADVVELPQRHQEVSQPSLLDELLNIDDVTDLYVYRLLTGRAEELLEVDPPARPDPDDVPTADGQLSLFLLVPGGRQ